MRTDKPKYKGTFYGQACPQSVLVSKPVAFTNQLGIQCFGRVWCRSKTYWVWNGEDWITELEYKRR